MTTFNELMDLVSNNDALEGRKYDVKTNHKCTKCNRFLKGKIGYLDLDNNLICYNDYEGCNKAQQIKKEKNPFI